MRRALIKLTPELLGDFCKDTLPGYALIVNGPVPDDAIFISAVHSFEHACFLICFEHESFEDIPEGQHLPFLPNAEGKFIKIQEN